MHHFNSRILGLTLALGFVLAPGADGRAGEAEYKAADQNFYLRASVVKANPAAVILRAGDYEQKGDSYFVPGESHAKQEVYLEVVKDWLEPVTPPSMPDSLGLAPDVMQIREPQGDVQVAPPENSSAFVPATEGMPIANGAVIKTGKDGTSAVLFGGVDSARLTPNSEALVQQTVMPKLRSTRIDLKSGVVFSKVGLRAGEKQDFEVHTPFGVAYAKGTDFVCVALPDRADVWVAQGTVRFDQPNGKTVGTVRSTGKSALKVIRFPVSPDAQAALNATTQTMTMALNFIPMANLKLKTLHDQIAQGVKMTPQETAYLKLMKQVTCLVRLTLVSAPLGPPVATAPVTSTPMTPMPTPVAAVPPTPSAAAAPVVAANPAQPSATPPPPALPAEAPVAPMAKPVPSMIVIDIAPDGSIHFDGAQLGAGHLERRLAKIAEESPKCAVVIRGHRKWQAARFQTVTAMCHEAKLENVSFDESGSPP